MYSEDDRFVRGWSLVTLREMRPGRCHFGDWLIAHREVMRFLVILCASGHEHWGSLVRVVAELSLRRCLEVRVIAAELIVISYLIEGVLISKEFVLCEADVVPLRIEFVCLLGCEVLTPTPRVIPVMMLKSFRVFLCNDGTIL